MKDKLIINKKGLKGEDGYKTFSVRLKDETVDKLNALADETNRSRNELINILLDFAIENSKVIWTKEVTMRKFKIPSIPPTTNKCVRFPNDVIENVEKAIQGKDCTFSAFVVEAVRVALENLEEEWD